jgi:hypothetical protein
MTDKPHLTPAELEALSHWASHGQPGVPQTATFVPDAETLANLHGFVAPESVPVELGFDPEQTVTLLRGFEPQQMEDKWMLIATIADGATAASVGFYRSWTRNLTIVLDLELTPDGAQATRLTWETSAERVKPIGGVEHWRGQVLEVCRWVLGMAV